ncbi:Ribosomal protein L10-like protein (mitochondrion) [Coccomyxa sp. Obi]|nr:Ribosomal protein L10-like protein [Coccomyxa sp. Obi]
MTKRKKLLQLHQIKKHLREKKILLFYQYNNINTRNWVVLRGELLSEIPSCQSSPIPSPPFNNSDNVETTNHESSISTLVVKSKIGQLSLAKALTQVECMANTDNLSRCPSNDTKCAELFQGPTFLFACNSHHEMVMGCKVIEKKRDRYNNNHLILLGGLYYGKVVTHLDIAKLSSLDSSIYASLLVTLENRTTSLLFDQLSYYQYELLRCLEHRRDTLSGITE